MTYSALLIGCGKIGSEFADDPRSRGIYTHAGAYHAHPATRLVAVCDLDPERAERCARRWSVPVWGTDPRRLLEEVTPAIVSLCTPDPTHAALLLAVLQVPSVRAILAEKPLATDLAQALRLLRQARERGVVLVVNYIRRYSPGFQVLKQALTSGALGGIQVVTGYYTKGTLHNGSHWLDLARYLFGEIRRVQAWDRLDEGGEDPSLDVSLEFHSGGYALLRALDTREYSLFEMDILGHRGRARMVDSGHLIERWGVARSERHSGYQVLKAMAPIDGQMNDGTFHALDDLICCLERGGTPKCSAADGVAALAAGLAARASVRLARPVDLDPGIWVE